MLPIAQTICYNLIMTYRNDNTGSNDTKTTANQCSSYANILGIKDTISGAFTYYISNVLYYKKFYDRLKLLVQFRFFSELS